MKKMVIVLFCNLVKRGDDLSRMVHSNQIACSFFMRAAVIRWLHRGSRPSIRSNSTG